jgi:hypothetical protein
MPEKSENYMVHPKFHKHPRPYTKRKKKEQSFDEALGPYIRDKLNFDKTLFLHLSVAVPR